MKNCVKEINWFHKIHLRVLQEQVSSHTLRVMQEQADRIANEAQIAVQKRYEYAACTNKLKNEVEAVKINIRNLNHENKILRSKFTEEDNINIQYKMKANEIEEKQKLVKKLHKIINLKEEENLYLETSISEADEMVQIDRSKIALLLTKQKASKRKQNPTGMQTKKKQKRMRETYQVAKLIHGEKKKTSVRKKVDSVEGDPAMVGMINTIIQRSRGKDLVK